MLMRLYKVTVTSKGVYDPDAYVAAHSISAVVEYVEKNRKGVGLRSVEEIGTVTVLTS